MNIQSNVLFNDIYHLKEELSQQQLSSAINRCFCQVEALAIMASIIDVEAIGNETVNNYLWALSDIVREAKWLFEHLISRY